MTMKKLEFKFPFYRFCGLDFCNCYASVYLYLQGTATKNANYYCQAMSGKGCNECWNCSDSLQEKSEILNNLFGMITKGQWVARQSWSGEQTNIRKWFADEYENSVDKTADFLAGFTGWDYKKITDKFNKHIASSVDKGKPIIAKIKSGDDFRVIIGYDGDKLIDPDYRPIDNPPSKPTSYEDIEFIYIFDKKIPQKYTFLDVFKIMAKAMESDFTEKIWDDFLENFDFEGGNLGDLNSSVIKDRYKRLRDVAGWIPNIGHGLGVTFGDTDLLSELGLDIGQFGELIDTIRNQGHLLHNRGYMIEAICNSAIALNVSDDEKWPWDNHGLITATHLIMELIVGCDNQILTAIKEAIRK